MFFALSRSSTQGKHSSRRRRGRRTFLPELLERRELLSTFYVTNNNDNGPGSLRFVIGQVNGDPLADGADTIKAQPGIGTIFPGSTLPALIRANITIEGFYLDGADAGSGADGLVIDADDTVNSVWLTGFKGTGISVNGNGAQVIICQIYDSGGPGLSLQGDGELASSGLVEDGDQQGISIGGSGDIVSSEQITGNAFDGVDVSGANNQIGGLNDGGPGGGPGSSGDLISGNGGVGVFVDGPDASGNVIEGDFIGTIALGGRHLPTEPGASSSTRHRTRPSAEQVPCRET